MLAQVPKGSAEMVAATIRAIFAQSGPAQVREQLGVIAGMLGRQFLRVEADAARRGPRHHRLRRVPRRALEEDLAR